MDRIEENAVIDSSLHLVIPTVGSGNRIKC